MIKLVEDHGYRFGFNGKELDDEVAGKGNTIAFEARIYDSRLGRFFTGDPRESEYPWQTTYAYFKNSPISQIDFLGKGGKDDKQSANNPNSKNPNDNSSCTQELANTSSFSSSSGSNYPQYTVQENETVWGIVRDNLPEGATNSEVLTVTKQVIAINNLNDQGAIKVGQILDMPKAHFIYQSLTPKIYEHTLNSLKANPSNIVLTYNGGGDAARKNRQAACRGFGKCPPGSSKDEFPYASTFEGGAGAKVICAPVKEQNIQSQQLRMLNSILDVGEKYLVFPVPSGSGVPALVTDPAPNPKRVWHPVYIPVYDYAPVPDIPNPAQSWNNMSDVAPYMAAAFAVIVLWEAARLYPPRNLVPAP
ncbi:MAG: LysM peptidoglycan-binding domain-containing protein [Bacteroidia bacterium]|nr:LysM peptidoglycan-binding domain-containing protein [Bacteroidia bacterium]